MANGTAAQPAAPRSSALAKGRPRRSSGVRTRCGPQKTGIEQLIGNATADAVIAISQALVDFQAMGVMSPLTRAQSGEVLGRVAELRLAHLGELPDFAVVAFAAGKRELHRRHGALFRQQLDLDEATLDGGLDGFSAGSLGSRAKWLQPSWRCGQTEATRAVAADTGGIVTSPNCRCTWAEYLAEAKKDH